MKYTPEQHLEWVVAQSVTQTNSLFSFDGEFILLDPSGAEIDRDADYTLLIDRALDRGKK